MLLKCCHSLCKTYFFSYIIKIYLILGFYMLSNTVSYSPKWFNFLLFYYIIFIFSLSYYAYMKTSALTSHNSSFYFVFYKIWFIIISNITTSQTTPHLWLMLLLYKGGTGNHINTGVVMTIPHFLHNAFLLKLEYYNLSSIYLNETPPPTKLFISGVQTMRIQYI